MTIKQAREIRERYAQGLISTIVLGREYGVSHQMVYDIIVGAVWKDAGGPIHQAARRMSKGA